MIVIDQSEEKKQKLSHILMLTTSPMQYMRLDTITDLFTFLLRYSFLLNDTSTPQNSRVQKTPQLNVPQGNIYMGARYLDPKYSRWISVDPALAEYIPSAGKSDEADKLPGMGGVFNSVNLSLFHYAGNNPVRYVDPDGRTTTITISNQKVKDLPESFRKQHGLIGSGIMRIVSVGKREKKQIDTYLVTVTDDKTDIISYYEISRDAPSENNRDKLAFNPKDEVELFYGRILDLGDGLGEKIELWNTGQGFNRESRADITGDGKPDYIQIHIGGSYQKDGDNYMMGSLGCFGLNGKDAGNGGRDRFMNDVSNRFETSGGKIEIYVERID